MFDNEPEPGTPEGDFFDVMVTLIEVYEAKHFPLDLPDPGASTCGGLSLNTPAPSISHAPNAATAVVGAEEDRQMSAG
jgi:hypothetical protein